MLDDRTLAILGDKAAQERITERGELLRIYDSLMLDDALIRHNVRLWVEVEGPAGDFAKARKAGKTQEALEAADRMWQVLYRMPPPKKEENERGSM